MIHTLSPFTVINIAHMFKHNFSIIVNLFVCF